MLIASVVTPKYLGVDGVIVSELIFTLVVILGNSYFLRKQVKRSLGIPKSLVSVTILTLSCSLLAHLLNGITQKLNGVFALIFSSAFAFLTYFTIAYLLGIFDFKLFFKRKKQVAL